MARSPFAVNVSAVLRQPGSRRREQRRGVIPELSVTGSEVPAGAEVEIDVVLEPARPGVLASGTVTTAWEGQCRRCLSRAGGELRADLRELFEERGDPETTYRLAGQELDLEPMARDAVLLELPLAPLCRPDCRGLCPICGTDRNYASCRCQAESGDLGVIHLDAVPPPESQ